MIARPLDAARDGLIALQGQLIALLAAQNAALAARVARLERAASRNSGNSSVPPSADDQPGRTPPAPAGRENKAKRRPGKQPGAPGSCLAWSQTPDDTVPHFPVGICGCGRDLAGAGDLGAAASHQEIDIPLATARVTQHDLHEVACACGRVHRAAAPPGAGAPGTVTYGVQLQAWCVYLIAAHHIPVHRAAQVIESLTGARPSPGFVHALIARAAAAVAEANTLIRAATALHQPGARQRFRHAGPPGLPSQRSIPMTTTASPVRLRQHSPAYWRVTFDNPPINLHDAEVVAHYRPTNADGRHDGNDRTSIHVLPERANC